MPDVEPGFSVGGGANPTKGTNIRLCQIFEKKLYEMENYLSWRVHVLGVSPRFTNTWSSYTVGHC